MAEAKAVVEKLVRSGKLLVNVINSSTYPDEVREAAMKLMRKNVVGLHRLKKGNTGVTLNDIGVTKEASC